MGRYNRLCKTMDRFNSPEEFPEVFVVPELCDVQNLNCSTLANVRVKLKVNVRYTGLGF